MCPSQRSHGHIEIDRSDTAIARRCDTAQWLYRSVVAGTKRGKMPSFLQNNRSIRNEQKHRQRHQKNEKNQQHSHHTH
jgi:hypothetical protein